MKKNNFLEGAFIATFAIIITKILGLLYVIPFYSIIGEQGGALYGYAYNIYNLFLIISTAGIPLAISKLTSEYNTLEMFNEKLKMYKLARNCIMIFSIISFLICFIFAPQIADLIIRDIKGGNTIQDVSFVIRMISFALLIIPHLSISRGYLQGHKYITQPSISQVIEQLVRIIVIIGGSYLSLKVFNLSLTTAVGISVLGAAIGGIVAYFYLFRTLSRNKKQLNHNIEEKSDTNSNKEIIKKIVTYSIPFIVISIANNLYNTTDMILVIRTLSKLGFDAPTVETISSIFTTWGNKLNTIVTAIATGLVISLIPNIVSSFVKKDMNDVNDKFNKTLQILLFVILPLTIFLSIFSEQVWTIFYGKSIYGPIIFKYTILVAFLDSAYIMICSSLQGLNKYKLIYISVCSGLLTNIILDVPLMILFHKLNIYSFYGAITATVIGYLVSLIIPLIHLKKKEKFNYIKTTKTIPNLLISISILVVCAYGIKLVIKNITSRLLLIPIITFIGLILISLYFFMNRKIFKNIFSNGFLKKIFKKGKKNNEI